MSFSQLTDEMFQIAEQCGAPAFLVYCYLLRRQGSNGHCWPSQQAIADGCFLSRRTVQFALKSLQQEQFVTVTQTGRSATYELWLHCPKSGRKICASEAQNMRIRSAKYAHRARKGALLEIDTRKKDPVWERLFGRGGTRNHDEDGI